MIIERGGYAVIFDVLDKETGEAKVKTYHPERAFYFKVDIADYDGVSAATAAALEVIPKGSLAGGVHCAAIAPGRQWSHKLRDSVSTFAKVLNINVYGTFVVDAVIADAINSQYPDQGPFGERTTEERGIIINIASAVARPVPARCLTYGASKTAVLGVSSGMSDFLGPFGIRVCSVSPAVVASALMGPDRLVSGNHGATTVPQLTLFQPYFEAELEAAAVFPRRQSDPSEVGHGIIFLIENGMMNDYELRIDGGWRNSSNWAGPVDPRKNAISLE